MIVQGKVKSSYRAAFSAPAITCVVGVIEDEDALRLGFFADAVIRTRLRPPCAATLAGAAITVIRVQAAPASGDAQGLHSYTLTATDQEV